MISVKMTGILEAQFKSEGLDHLRFVQLFSQWKAGGKKSEDDFYEFGKDGAYIKPQVNNQSYVLKHVHLVPILDLHQKQEWDRR